MVRTSFVWFEFDKEVEALWQSMSAGGKRFAYHQRLSTLIHHTPHFGVDLDSLKVLDVFLSAVKSDLASKHVSEGRVLAHDEFARLVIVLLYHVVRVIEHELMASAPKSTITLYAAQGFSRIYTRLFSQLGTSHHNGSLSDEELDAFYYGMAVLCQSVNIRQQAVADRFFILPIIGARLFGSMDRMFMSGLDDEGRPVGTSEDSLYWAVHDFVMGFRARQKAEIGDDRAKALFDKQTLAMTTGQASAQGLIEDEVRPLITQSSVATNDPLTHSDTAHAEGQTTLDTTSSLANQTNPSKIPSPSSYKQKAKASHTPKLFDEVHHDLSHMNTPSDAVSQYQKASAVLVKFDKFIDAKISEGKSQDEIVFNDNQLMARKQALTVLASLVKQGNPSAMLRLALCYFGGRGVTRDIQKALMLTKRSAEMGDIRAQKLLSRLYYQGFLPEEGGVAMDVAMGEYWLRKSAEGGHPEAKKVCAYMNQVEILKNDYHAQSVSDKRYGMLFIALGVGTVLLFILLSILF